MHGNEGHYYLTNNKFKIENWDFKSFSTNAWSWSVGISCVFNLKLSGSKRCKWSKCMKARSNSRRVFRFGEFAMATLLDIQKYTTQINCVAGWGYRGFSIVVGGYSNELLYLLYSNTNLYYVAIIAVRLKVLQQRAKQN